MQEKAFAITIGAAFSTLLSSSAIAKAQDIPVLWAASAMAGAGKVGRPCTIDRRCDAKLACLADDLNPLKSMCVSAKGSTSTAYGGMENRCTARSPSYVMDWIHNFWGNTLNGRFAFDAREQQALLPDNSVFPDLNPFGFHIQGIQRVVGSPGENRVAMTISNGGVDGGIFFVDLANVSGHGGEPFLVDSMSTASNRNVAFYRTPSRHPGGFQIIDSVAFIPGPHSTTGRPTVWLYDVSDPLHTPSSAAMLQAIDLNALGPAVSQSLSAAAVTRLSNGRYLLVVSGRSLQNERHIWMYVSRESLLSSKTSWTFHNEQIYQGIPTENINFLTSCTGDQFLMATGNTATPDTGGFGDTLSEGMSVLQQITAQQAVTVSSLTTGSDSKFVVSSAGTYTGYAMNNYCNFVAASAFHVTPTGEIVVYCANRALSESGAYRFGEIVQPAP